MKIIRPTKRKKRQDPSKSITNTLKTRRLRLVGVFVLVCVWVGVIVMRLVSLQILDFSRWEEWAIKQHLAEVKLASQRGSILDRNGKLLAVSVPTGSVYVRPQQVQGNENLVDSISNILQLDKNYIRKKFSEKSPFVWIQRQVPRIQAERIKGLNNKGVGYVMEARRYYPYNGAASTLIGRVGVDGVGLSGIEKTFENYLRVEGLESRVKKDAFGNIIDTGEMGNFVLPKGEPLKLTIDSGLQLIMDEELEQGRTEAKAKRAMALMVDANTGEILAMSQAPHVNSNSQNIGSHDELRNYVVETVFEPGSIIKPMVAAAAIESKVVSVNEIIDCESGTLSIGHHLIQDVHPYDKLLFYDVLVRSSNIGMAKIGSRLGKERLYGFLRRFGFGESTALGLPGETKGILRQLDNWAKVDVATHAFGQGIAVTPLQLARATSAIANGGHLPSLRVVYDDKPTELRRVVSEDTARQVRGMMQGVVEDEHGTGRKAAIQGLLIGGKTGTAQKARKEGRGYEPGAYVASFVGFADGRSLGLNKLLTLVVVVDEPNTTSIFGGTLAAPIFSRVMQRSTHYLLMQEEVLPKREIKDFISPVSVEKGVELKSPLRGVSLN